MFPVERAIGLCTVRRSEGRFGMRTGIMRNRAVLLVLSVALVGVLEGSAVAAGSPHKPRARVAASTIVGPSAPTFVGPAATGCRQDGCSLLTGPFVTPSTAGSANSTAGAKA